MAHIHIFCLFLCIESLTPYLSQTIFITLVLGSIVTKRRKCFFLVEKLTFQ